MDSKLEEQRCVIKFLFREGEKLFQRLQKSFSKACIFYSNFSSWVSQLREGRPSMRGKPRPGRPAKAVAPTMVAIVKVFVNKDCRETLQEVANQFSIGKPSAHEIFHKNTVDSRYLDLAYLE